MPNDGFSGQTFGEQYDKSPFRDREQENLDEGLQIPPQRQLTETSYDHSELKGGNVLNTKPGLDPFFRAKPADSFFHDITIGGTNAETET
jgi:hypothetical protein